MPRRKTAKTPTKRPSNSTRAGPAPAGVIELGDRRELFVDDYLIERLSGVELRLQKPAPRNVAIDHDVPWEGNTSAYHTVFRDGRLMRTDCGGPGLAVGPDVRGWRMFAEFTQRPPDTRKKSAQPVAAV